MQRHAVPFVTREGTGRPSTAVDSHTVIEAESHRGDICKKRRGREEKGIPKIKLIRAQMQERVVLRTRVRGSSGKRTMLAVWQEKLW